MKKNMTVGGTAPKIATALFSIASLGMLGAGIYFQDWYAGFGLVMFMTSLICGVAAHLGATTNSEAVRGSTPVSRKAEASYLKPVPSIDVAS